MFLVGFFFISLCPAAIKMKLYLSNFTHEVTYLNLIPLGRPQYEVVRDAGGLEVARHAHRQRVAARLRRAAAHQERAHRLAAQHL